jgi:molecular chaperone DnaK
MKIGIDFGTTNSILSYMDGDILHAYKHGGASCNNYIRSCVAINKDDSTDISIGESALIKQTDSDYNTYINFKMLLTEQHPSVLQQHGYHHHNPREIAKHYLNTLIESYCANQQIERSDLKKVVITIPEVWVRQGEHEARHTLMQICNELRLPVKLYSEPVAAAVYFASAFKKKKGAPFNGYLLVCDYGGGTLDLSLCKLENERIEVLEGVGSGKSHGGSLGNAGVAYDEYVVKRFIERNKLTNDNYHRLLLDFEKAKISNADLLKKSISNYIGDPDTDKRVFRLDGLEIRTSDLVKCFQEIIENNLKTALNEMQGYLQKHNIKTEDSQQFRVVMVGGFSNFYPVRDMIKSFFDSKTEADQRFQSLTLEDTALAISKGAALIANDVYTVTQNCPVNIGFRAIDQNLKEIDKLILEKGKDLDCYQQPVYMERRISTIAGNYNIPLTVFIDIGHNNRKYIDLKTLAELIPPNPSTEDSWRIGFSIDDNLFFYFHAENEKGEAKKTDLVELTRYIKGIHIKEK